MMEKSEFTIDKVSIRLVKDSSLYIDYPLDSAEKIADVIGGELRDMDREVFCVINLKADLSVASYTFASVGSIDRSIVHPREVFKSAILSNACSIIIMHNHPSGNIQPSDPDIFITQRMNECCELMGFPLLDHIIVGAGNKEYFSFKEHDMLIGKSSKRDFSLAAEESVSLSKLKR